MNPRDNDDGFSIAGGEQSTGVSVVVATPEQLFDGHPVGPPSLTVQCSKCGSRLSEGDQVSVTARRRVDTPRWDVVHCRCPDCPPATIETPTLSVTEVHLNGRLGVVTDVTIQQHWLCLLEPTLNRVSDPLDRLP